MSAAAENELPPPADALTSGQPVSRPPAGLPFEKDERRKSVVEVPGDSAANGPNRVREIRHLVGERESPWRAHVVAGAVGAGLTLVALALRDTLGDRRAALVRRPPTLRKRVASWLRGEDLWA